MLYWTRTSSLATLFCPQGTGSLQNQIRIPQDRESWFEHLGSAGFDRLGVCGSQPDGGIGKRIQRGIDEAHGVRLARTAGTQRLQLQAVRQMREENALGADRPRVVAQGGNRRIQGA